MIGFAVIIGNGKLVLPDCSNVPDELTDRIVEKCKLYPNSKYHFAAYECITYYTRLQITEAMFEEFSIYVKDPRPGNYRLLQLGNSIFVIRNEAVLEELTRRLHDRPLRSVFFELTAAAFCRDMGFSLLPGPGLAKRGFDYDFELHNCIQVGPIYLIDPFMESPIINVEVTELQTDTLNPERLISRLKSKSRQLSPERPSIIFCFFPFSWTQDDTDWQECMADATRSFFADNGRINWVIFAREYVGDAPMEEAEFVQHFICMRNMNPRHPAIRLNTAIANKIGVSEVVQRQPGLNEWVDTLVSQIK